MRVCSVSSVLATDTVICTAIARTVRWNTTQDPTAAQTMQCSHIIHGIYASFRIIIIIVIPIVIPFSSLLLANPKNNTFYLMLLVYNQPVPTSISAQCKKTRCHTWSQEHMPTLLIYDTIQTSSRNIPKPLSRLLPGRYRYWQFWPY